MINSQWGKYILDTFQKHSYTAIITFWKDMKMNQFENIIHPLVSKTLGKLL